MPRVNNPAGGHATRQWGLGEIVAVHMRMRPATSVIKSRMKPPAPRAEETPVDDVRRVGRKLSDETGNDVGRLADRGRERAEKLREKLGLKPARR